MMSTVFSVISNALSLGVFIFFIYKSLGFKDFRIWDYAIGIGLFFLKIYFNDLEVPALNLLNTFMLDLYLLFKAYGNLIKKLWLLIIYIALTILSEEAGLYIFEINLDLLFTKEIGLFISLIVSKIFLFILIYVFTIMNKVIEYEEVQYKHVFILMLFPLSTIMLFLSMRHPLTYNDVNISMLFAIILLLIANVGCMYEYYLLAKSNRIKIENAIMKERLESDKKYIALYNTKLETDRSIMHDIKKHANYLQGLLLKDNIIEAKNYLQTYILNLNYRNIITGNDSFDIILNMYSDKIREERIILDCSGVQPVHLEWVSHIDQCTIFGNLIENAIESCVKCDKRKITFIMKECNGKIVYRMENSYNPKYLDNNETTKDNKEYHSYGLKNVQAALDKYQGLMKTDVNLPNMQYITTIIFQLHKLSH